jgi:sterol desaturase/sphingolipid hydroxylase (fatty acid hydroxylase superfamily)
VFAFALLAVTVVALLTLAELLFGGSLGGDRLVNITIWIVRRVLAFAFMPGVALYFPFSLIDGVTLPFAAAFAIYFVAMDLGEYLFHRAQHTIPWLWKLHALHHSDPDMNATTTERHFWGDQFLKAVTIYPAAVLLIQPTPVVLLAYILVTQWNFVAHARLPWSFGQLSWALNSPAYHRRHHSSLPEHYNSNFAAILPIWDLLLGSYHVPQGNMPPTGLGGKPPTALDVFAWPLRPGAGTRRRSKAAVAAAAGDTNGDLKLVHTPVVVE